MQGRRTVRQPATLLGIGQQPGAGDTVVLGYAQIKHTSSKVQASEEVTNKSTAGHTASQKPPELYFVSERSKAQGK